MDKNMFYQCEKGDNVFALLKSGGGLPECCGQEMKPLIANTTDASQEKHVPVVTLENGKIKVTVGSAVHPMVTEHFIEWIALITEDRNEIVYLKPGMEPVAEFANYVEEDEESYTDENDEIVPNCEGSPCNFVSPGNDKNKVAVYAYCNLHGLWKTEL